ncbi:MAG: ATP-binding protein [Treponema sp.]|nr:ATP-binding protein [Treponema sp.]
MDPVTNRKKRKFDPFSFYTQILVIVAFVLMGLSSFLFTSNIERQHLIKDAENAIASTEAHLVASFLEPETFLRGFSETIRSMILRGDSTANISEHMKDITSSTLGDEMRLPGFTSFFGFFESLGGVYITGLNWIPHSDYIATIQNNSWYIAAVEAEGGVAVTEPYYDTMTGGIILTFSRRIYDDSGRALGIVCMNINLGRILEDATNIKLTENSYGILLDSQINVIFHPFMFQMGMPLRDSLDREFAVFEDELRQGLSISERRAVNFNNQNSIIFFQPIRYGWHLGVVVPVSEYLGSVYNMAIFLIVLGGTLTITLSFVLFRIFRAKKLSDLRAQERSNIITVMQNNMKIGLFFMNKANVIQDHYSRYLEDMLSEDELSGRLFTDIIAKSVTSNELESIKDYFRMVAESTYDQEILDDINPLNELHYVNARNGDRKIFQCAFATVEQAQGEIFLLVTVYDITAKVELQQRLAEEEAKRQEEMASVFELIQVQPDVFGDFMEDMEFEFDSIDKILKHDELTAHEALIKVYQSVHAIKSNAVILGLNVFGAKVHNLETKIKNMREKEGEIPFVDMLNLAMEIEKISQEKEGFRDVIDKLQSYTSDSGSKNQNVKVLVESLAKTASRAAEDMGKQVFFIADDIQPVAINIGPRRVMKEILMQLIRNSAVHGIETPDVRKSKGKNETGIIKVSIKMSDDNQYIKMKMSDDGKGLDYKTIGERAVSQNIIRKENAENKDMLIKAIFAPGFSTSENEGMHAGRGIGLNLVRDRVKEVNGTMSLHSEADRGIAFFVSIPVQMNQNQN